MAKPDISEITSGVIPNEVTKVNQSLSSNFPFFF
jgi:hypothetical protein